jgi:cytochrome oxidase Cu insertion factor (SCO1/SenC/PrrC family)
MDRSKLKLSLILLMVTVPISLATLVYHFSFNTGSLGTTSRGTLVVPVIDITELQLQDADDQPAYLGFEELTAGVTPKQYKPRPWQLLYFGGENCDASCQQRLYFLRQLHVRLGGDSSRVKRAYVLTGSGAAQVDAATMTYLQDQQADMRILHGNLATMANVLHRSSTSDPISGHYIYLMDPVGNLMLYFTPDEDAEDILKDLKKLLDASSLG